MIHSWMGLHRDGWRHGPVLSCGPAERFRQHGCGRTLRYTDRRRATNTSSLQAPNARSKKTARRQFFPTTRPSRPSSAASTTCRIVQSLPETDGVLCPPGTRPFRELFCARRECNAASYAGWLFGGGVVSLRTSFSTSSSRMTISPWRISSGAGLRATSEMVPPGSRMA